jgi:hypothetical protein
MVNNLAVSPAVIVTVWLERTVMPEDSWVGFAVAVFQVLLSGEDSQVRLLFQLPEIRDLKKSVEEVAEPAAVNTLPKLPGVLKQGTVILYSNAKK